MNTENALEVQNLTKEFGSLAAVDRVSFEVGTDTIVGLAGPNGAGKTTLFNLLSGFVNPTEGDVELFDQSVIGKSPQQIVKLGLGRTFQNSRVVPTMTVFENIMISSLFGQGMSKKKAIDETNKIVDQFDLHGLVDVRGNDLDLFEMKQVTLARVYATDADVLLLDEPFAGLNEEEINGMIDQIKTTQGISNSTILIIDHNFEMLVEFAKRIIILDSGNILADDTPERARTNDEVKRVYLGEQ
jgi:ABC-type branched-subunit amino acid transport system ATPase component